MNKKKKTLLVIGGLLGIILIMFVVNIISSNKTQTSDRPDAPSLPTTAPLPKSKINIGDIPEGTDKLIEGDIEINNFYSAGQVVNDNGDVIVNKSDKHKTLYFPVNSQFLISITDSPFIIAKSEAESSFLQTTGVTQEEACQLNVVITTPRFVNPDEAGQEYKLSFCEQ